MRSWIPILAATVTAGLALIADVPRSEAATVYPWCLHLGGRNGALSCGYSTYAQCMASSQGSSWCGENPFYEPPRAQPRRTRRSQS